MGISEGSIVESEKFLVKDETLGECNSNNGHGSQVDKKTCVHHWLIEAPNGNTSSGTCKLCGEVRKDYFLNSMEQVGWSSVKPKNPVKRNKKREEKDKRTRLNEITDEYLI